MNHLPFIGSSPFSMILTYVSGGSKHTEAKALKIMKTFPTCIQQQGKKYYLVSRDDVWKYISRMYPKFLERQKLTNMDEVLTYTEQYYDRNGIDRPKDYSNQLVNFDPNDLESDAFLKK